MKIRKYINKEVQEVETLIKNNSKIIPEINFNDLTLNLNKDIINSINQRGCVVIRDVFDNNQMQQWNKSLENYIEQNNYYDDQKEKVGIDQYFSELKSGKPQIFGLYWSKTQIEIRQSNQLDAVKIAFGTIVIMAKMYLILTENLFMLIESDEESQAIQL